jgi:thiol:disulfide interchange protein DsbC
LPAVVPEKDGLYMRSLPVFVILLLFATQAYTMSPDSCGSGVCADCHSITKEETKQILGSMVDKVNHVEFAEVPGMWVVEIEKDSRKIPVYIDFSKRYLVSGNVIRLEDKENVTQTRAARMNRIDISKIPLADALVLGKSSAKNKVIVFTDPQCPYCKKLHDELKEVVRRDPEIAFLIKLFPLPMHPEAHGISQSIVCNNSMEYLERSFAGEPIPAPNCEIPVVDQTIEIGKQLGIRSTPTLVMPDGLVVPGYKKAEALLAIIGENIAQLEK